MTPSLTLPIPRDYFLVCLAHPTVSPKRAGTGYSLLAFVSLAPRIKPDVEWVPSTCLVDEQMIRMEPSLSPMWQHLET